MTPRDHRDLALEDLATREQELLERIVSLELDVTVYQQLLREALNALREFTERHEADRRRYSDLRDEFSTFRERLLRDRSVAA